jgi:hypothetical protein
MIIGTLCFVLILTVAAIYFLIPLPLLSYQQGSVQTDHGEVTKVKNIRLGVREVSLSQGMEIDPRLQHGNARMTSASLTLFINFRKGQPLPEIGDKVSVTSINRLHRFTGRSFNWAKEWKLLKGDVPTGGRVVLVTD